MTDTMLHYTNNSTAVSLTSSSHTTSASSTLSSPSPSSSSSATSSSAATTATTTTTTTTTAAAAPAAAAPHHRSSAAVAPAVGLGASDPKARRIHKGRVLKILHDCQALCRRFTDHITELYEKYQSAGEIQDAVASAARLGLTSPAAAVGRLSEAALAVIAADQVTSGDPATQHQMQETIVRLTPADTLVVTPKTVTPSLTQLLASLEEVHAKLLELNAMVSSSDTVLQAPQLHTHGYQLLTSLMHLLVSAGWAASSASWACASLVSLSSYKGATWLSNPFGDIESVQLAFGGHALFILLYEGLLSAMETTLPLLKSARSCVIEQKKTVTSPRRQRSPSLRMRHIAFGTLHENLPNSDSIDGDSKMGTLPRSLQSTRGRIRMMTTAKYFEKQISDLSNNLTDLHQESQDFNDFMFNVNKGVGTANIRPSPQSSPVVTADQAYSASRLFSPFAKQKKPKITQQLPF
jgi:hypothetical protein